jgi:hypothetical protein
MNWSFELSKAPTASFCSSFQQHQAHSSELHFAIYLAMADVRSLLKNERASRRIQHKYASYSTTGTLLCTVCHLQLKSETLWEGHLRSAGHLMRFQKLQEQEKEPSPSANTEPPPVLSKKRKASDDEEEGTIRKRSKAPNGLPEGFFDSVPEENGSTLSLPKCKFHHDQPRP